MRRWRRLLNLLERLARSRTSWLSDAMADDEELAEFLVKNEKRDEDRKPTRSVRDYSPVVELLSVVADRQAELAQIMAATKGAKPRKVQPMPRPQTAYMRARARKSRHHHAFTVGRVFGYIDAKGNPTGKEPPQK